MVAYVWFGGSLWYAFLCVVSLGGGIILMMMWRAFVLGQRSRGGHNLSLDESTGRKEDRRVGR